MRRRRRLADQFDFDRREREAKAERRRRLNVQPLGEARPDVRRQRVNHHPPAEIRQATDSADAPWPLPRPQPPELPQ